MKPNDSKPGDKIPPCQEAPTLRVRQPDSDVQKEADFARSEGYSSRGYIRHFLSDREVNLSHLNEALADVFGEPALRLMKMDLVIDEEVWKQFCGDPWSGNIYRYAFFAPDRLINEVEDLRASVRAGISGEVERLEEGQG